MKMLFEINDVVTLAYTEIGIEDKVGKPFQFLAYLQEPIKICVKDKKIIFDSIVCGKDDKEIYLAKSTNLKLLEVQK